MIECKFQVDFLRHYQCDVKEDEVDCSFIDFFDEMSMFSRCNRSVRLPVSIDLLILSLAEVSVANLSQPTTIRVQIQILQNLILDCRKIFERTRL